MKVPIVIASLCLSTVCAAQQRMQLVEVARFGGEAEGPASVAQLQGIAVARDGSIVVADGQPMQLKVFSSSGQFLRTIGRIGEGPGEYRVINSVSMSPDGEIMLLDLQLLRMTYYSLDGKVVSTKRLPGMPCCRLDGRVLPSGEILEPIGSRRTVLPGIPAGHFAVRRIAANGTVRDTTHYPMCQTSSKIAREFIRMTQRDGVYFQLRAPLLPSPETRFDSDGSMWCAPTDQYVLYKFGANRSDTLQTIRLQVKAPPVSDSMRKATVSHYPNAVFEDGSRYDASSVPRTLPVIEDIAIDDVHNVWVRRTDTSPATPSFDVFDRSGRQVMSVSTSLRWRGIPMVHQGFAYGVVVDGDEVPYIVKAQLRAK